MFLLFVGAAGAQEEEFEALVDRAQQAYQAGNLPEAEELYRQAISLDDQNAALYYNLGNVYYDMGSYGEAIAAYDKSVELGGDDLRVYYNLGNAYYRRGNFDAALAAYEDAREAGEGEGPDGQLSVNTAKTLRQLGRDQEARALLEDYLGQNSGDALGWFHLGNIVYDAGEYEQAASHFSRAVESREGFIRAQFNLGNTLYRLGSFREAAAAFEAVVSGEPDNADAIYNLGLSYLSLAERLREEEE
jgi:tetratricopeptide (TPR) repeat protein